MKLTIKRNEFLRRLSFTAQAVPSRSAEAQYRNYLIEVKEDGVSVIASDGDRSCKAFSSRKDEKGNDIILSLEPGLIQVQAKTLLEIRAKLSSDIVTLVRVDTNFLNVSDDVSNYNLITKAGEEYPDVALSVPEGKMGFKVQVKDRKKLFDTTAYAAASRGPKPLFFGVNVRAQGGKLYFLATDSYRRARNAVSVEDQAAEFNFTCSVKTLNRVTGLNPEDRVTIYLDDQRALFVGKNCRVSTRLIQGDFPTPDRIIPPSFPYQVTLKAQEFLVAADRVKIIILNADDRNNRVRLTLSKDSGVTISANSTSMGNASETLKPLSLVRPDNENVFEVGFNVDYVTAAVKALQSDEITLTFSSPNRRFMAKNKDPENIQIITPIRLSSYN